MATLTDKSAPPPPPGTVGPAAGTAANGGAKHDASAVVADFSREDPTTIFELLEKRGRGSYGTVYKVASGALARHAGSRCERDLTFLAGCAVAAPQARNMRTNEIVAIKIVSLDETDQGLESIRKEISVLKECNHPNIVRYYGSYFKDDYLWVRASMPLLSGASRRRVLSERRRRRVRSAPHHTDRHGVLRRRRREGHCPDPGHAAARGPDRLCVPRGAQGTPARGLRAGGGGGRPDS